MTAEDWILAASLAVNVCLFFKGALNDVIVTKFKARFDRAERQRQLLVELNGRLQSFDATYFMLLAAQGLQSRVGSEDERQRVQKTLDALSPKHIETVEFLAGHDLEFPEGIRRQVRELRQAMIFEDIGKLGDLQAILERSQLVTEAVNKIKAELEQTVK